MAKKILFAVAVTLAAGVIAFFISKNAARPDGTPTPTPLASPQVSASASPTPSRMPTPSPTSTKTPTPSPSPTQTTTSSPTPSPTPSPTQAPTQTPTPTTTPSPTPPPGPQTHDIRIQDFAYFPGTLNVKLGDIVRFTNYDAFNHDATHDGGDWHTSLLSQGESDEIDTADLAPGTYRYHCSIHGQAMVGTLRIIE